MNLMKYLTFFHKIDNNHHKINEYNPRAPNMTNRKNEILDYLKIMEWKLFDMLFTRKKTIPIKSVMYMINQQKN